MTDKLAMKAKPSYLRTLNTTSEPSSNSFHSYTIIMFVELHSMLLTIFPFMFWDDSKTSYESILSLLVFLAKNGIPGLLL